MLEVEAKARVRDYEKIEEAIIGLGGSFDREEIQVDTYFGHPLRDFKESDEALRIRTVNSSDFFVTYKGPKVDDLTKTREEIEVGVGDFIKIRGIFEKLGFFEVFTVEKNRRYFVLDDSLIMLDRVVDLGDFVEVELEKEEYDPDEVLDVLRSLGIEDEDFERRSYLGLLLEKQLL